ncbi:MAG: hypothetical protein AAF432_02130 [Planctomycetota bacterium]
MLTLRDIPGVIAIAGTMLMIGCESAPRNMAAIRAYYDYDFTTAREGLRADAYTRDDEQTLLYRSRLGLAALADGDVDEAESNLTAAFDILSTAGLNEDRTTAAILTHEGARIWKGEPFEQAMLYHYTALTFALRGDWENMRAASANAMFRLTDFGGVQNKEELARRAASDDVDPASLYTPVDTDFALGALMQAIGTDLSGLSSANEIYDLALEINPALTDVVEPIRAGAYNTLLVVDYGKGPTKISYGPDGALSTFEPQDEASSLTVSADGLTRSFEPIADLNVMARDLRWNHFEDVRVAKSVIGEGLILGGGIVATTAQDYDDHDHDGSYGYHGYDHHHDVDTDWGQLAVGLGMILAGALMKSGAEADTRYLEFVPQTVFIVPLDINTATTIDLDIAGSWGATMRLVDVAPGTTRDPNVVYVRLHGEADEPEWMRTDALQHGNDVVGVLRGDYPWILGGRDVSTPTRDTLAAYQANGFLRGWTIGQLRALYDAEGILIGSGMEASADAPKNPSFRHILEGGRGLFTPRPGSNGYKRLMYQPHQPYVPNSAMGRNAAEEIRVQMTTGEAASAPASP